MRVAVITPYGAPHSLELCAAIAEEHDLVGVLHPHRASRSRAQRVRQLRRETSRLGPVNEALRILGSCRSPLRGWDASSDERDALEQMFRDAHRRYSARAAGVAEQVADVNAPAVVSHLQALAPDVVCCLGGPIYRAPLIESVPLMLNFHSGVSPLYNGASTIAFAFANGHFGLCGGTLMTMSTAVDGGDILAHHLPAIEAGDTPGRLFAKTVAGAIDAYRRVLAHLAGGGSLVGFAQPAPLSYFRASDWTVYHGQRVRRLVRSDAPATAARGATLVRYWDAATPTEARERVHATLAGLVA